jgi:hypothetical protein
MENHSHIMAEVGGSNPPISTFFVGYYLLH